MTALRLVLLSAFALPLRLLAAEPALTHPDTTGAGWGPVFKADLSDGQGKPGVWTVDAEGVLTASADEALWSPGAHKDFVLDLEFRTADGSNSGVIVHASDTGNWIPNSVEIQIADDHGRWGKENPTFRCGAIFGHQAASKSTVKKPGEWNRYTITCIGKRIWVVLNGELVNDFDMARHTSAKKNPDGTDIPGWLSRPKAELPLEGRIGFQGKHAGAPIWFRNIRIRALAAS